MLIRRSFRIDKHHYTKAAHHIEELLADIDTRLADGRKSILGGDTINYTDIAFAALSGPWLMPKGYGGGMADACRIERNEAPGGMRAEIERWVEDYPKAATFVERLYAEERDALEDETLHEVLLGADILSPWTVGRYRTPEEMGEHQEVMAAD